MSLAGRYVATPQPSMMSRCLLNIAKRSISRLLNERVRPQSSSSFTSCGASVGALHDLSCAVRLSHLLFEIAHDDVTPVLWVVMGVAAITTNAGSALTLTDSHLPFLQTMLPFIDGATFMMWASSMFMPFGPPRNL